jgi:CO/xanthine dehydrogenase Mo-binding subunit
MAGNAVAAAATELKKQIANYAAELFEASPADIVIEHGRVHVAGSPDKSVSLRDLAMMANPIGYPGEREGIVVGPAYGDALKRAKEKPAAAPMFEARGYFGAGQQLYGSGVHAATVEVDPDTGRVRILKYIVVHDCGVIVNPAIVEGQILGGVAQGIGGALLERLLWDESGQPQTTSFMDFRLPTVDDIPEIILDHVETPSPLNPLGVKGTGEAGIIPSSAVIAEAVEDALSPFGIRVNEMPIFPADVKRLIKEASKKEKVGQPA